jgi:uncharacterized protein
VTGDSPTKWIPDDAEVAIQLRLAVRFGDVEAVQRLLRDDPGLASARLGAADRGSSTALHLVTDWPGYFPNGPQIVRLLIEAGADPNALTFDQGPEPGPGSETPLHYAASSDDVDVAEAVIDGGADLVTEGLSAEAVSQAFWHACAGAQRRPAEYLLGQGAGLNWEPDYAHGTPLDSATGPKYPAGERHHVANRAGSTVCIR